jgi:large subunit ribosomal protein L25
MSNTVYQITKRRDNVKAKQLRKEGFVPGIIYGSEFKESIPVEIKTLDLVKMLKEHTRASILTFEGLGNPINVIVKEIQKDNVSHLPIHIDFQAIKKGEIITVNMAIVILGEEALKIKQLMYQPNLTHIELKGPAENLPERIEFDVSELVFEDKVLVQDIKLPEGIVSTEESDALIGNIAAVQEMEVEVEEEEIVEPVVTGEVAEPTKE